MQNQQGYNEVIITRVSINSFGPVFGQPISTGGRLPTALAYPLAKLMLEFFVVTKRLI